MIHRYRALREQTLKLWKVWIACVCHRLEVKPLLGSAHLRLGLDPERLAVFRHEPLFQVRQRPHRNALLGIAPSDFMEPAQRLINLKLQAL